MSVYPPIQIVDKNDVPLHGGTPHEAYKLGLIHRTVYVLVEDTDGRILLQRRGPSVATFPNAWDVAVAGYVDEGESYEAAAVRELQEELGVSGYKLKKVDHFYTEDIEGGLMRNRFCGVYKVVISPGTKLVLAPDEISEVLWLYPNEMKAFLSKNAKEIAGGLRDTLERHSTIWKSLA